MRTSVIAVCAMGIVIVGVASPASGTTSDRVAGAVIAAEAQARSYVDDPDYYLLYRSLESSSNCGGNPACDIDFSSYLVDKEFPDNVAVVVGMSGPTDANLSTSDKGGMLVLIDSDDDPSTWDYRM